MVLRGCRSVVRLVLAHLQLGVMRPPLQAARTRHVASDESNEIDKSDYGKLPRLENHGFGHIGVGGDKRNQTEGDASDGEKAEADKAGYGPALGLLQKVHGSQEQQRDAGSHEGVNELMS